MIDINLKGRPEELIQAEQLILEGKFEEAHQLMDKFKEKGEYTLKDTLSCNLLKTEIMFQQGLYKDVIKLTNQTYKESLGLGESLVAFDALNLMSKALFFLYRVDEALEKVKESKELLKILPHELPREYNQRKADLEYLKAWFYMYKDDADKAVKHGGLCITLLEEIGDNRKLAEALISMSKVYTTLKGDLDIALRDGERGLALAKEINFKIWIAIGLDNRATIYLLKGNLNRSLMLYKQSLAIFKELNNKNWISITVNNIAHAYRLTGDLNKTLEYLEQSLALTREVGNKRFNAVVYMNIIEILIEKGDFERANQEVRQFEQLSNLLEDIHINRWYRFNKALLLKTSLRAPNRGEAEVILKQILNEAGDDYQLSVGVLLNICELLLIELRLLNDLEVLEELESLIAQLLELAEKSHSYHLLAETHFLKGKLALLTLDMREARKSLTQAQRIAERWGFNQLATKISLEHDKLRNQLSMWDDLREEEISLSERMKLAGMDEQMEYLLRKRATLTTQVKEEQITVHKERKICIVCKGDILGFMYACSCDALYCEKCARALSEIENVCWVCNIPIDITKPIKPYKEKEVGKKDIIKEPYKNPKNDDIPLKK